jgi:hypothetical protein
MILLLISSVLFLSLHHDQFVWYAKSWCWKRFREDRFRPSLFSLSIVKMAIRSTFKVIAPGNSFFDSHPYIWVILTRDFFGSSAWCPSAVACWSWALVIFKIGSHIDALGVLTYGWFLNPPNRCCWFNLLKFRCGTVRPILGIWKPELINYLLAGVLLRLLVFSSPSFSSFVRGIINLSRLVEENR